MVYHTRHRYYAVVVMVSICLSATSYFFFLISLLVLLNKRKPLLFYGQRYMLLDGCSLYSYKCTLCLFCIDIADVNGEDTRANEQIAWLRFQMDWGENGWIRCVNGYLLLTRKMSVHLSCSNTCYLMFIDITFMDGHVYMGLCADLAWSSPWLRVQMQRQLKHKPFSAEGVSFGDKPHKTHYTNTWMLPNIIVISLSMALNGFSDGEQHRAWRWIGLLIQV